MSGTAETTITNQSGQRSENVGVAGVLATPGDRRGDQGGATEMHYSQVIQKLLGDRVNVSSVLSHNIDMRDGYPHSTTGIPQAIHGYVARPFPFYLHAGQTASLTSYFFTKHGHPG